MAESRVSRVQDPYFSSVIELVLNKDINVSLIFSILQLLRFQDLQTVYQWISCLKTEVFHSPSAYDWFLQRDMTKTLHYLLGQRPHIVGETGQAQRALVVCSRKKEEKQVFLHHLFDNKDTELTRDSASISEGLFNWSKPQLDIHQMRSDAPLGMSFFQT